MSQRFLCFFFYSWVWEIYKQSASINLPKSRFTTWLSCREYLPMFTSPLQIIVNFNYVNCCNELIQCHFQFFCRHCMWMGLKHSVSMLRFTEVFLKIFLDSTYPHALHILNNPSWCQFSHCSPPCTHLKGWPLQVRQGCSKIYSV